MNSESVYQISKDLGGGPCGQICTGNRGKIDINNGVLEEELAGISRNQ
jgi:hypothetical protein